MRGIKKNKWQLGALIAIMACLCAIPLGGAARRASHPEPRLVFAQGLLYFERGDYESATREWDRLLEYDTLDPEVSSYYEKAYELMRYKNMIAGMAFQTSSDQNYEEALALLNSIIEEYGPNPTISGWIDQIETNQNNAQEYRRLQDLIARGDSFITSNYWEKALTCFQEALFLDASNDYAQRQYDFVQYKISINHRDALVASLLSAASNYMKDREYAHATDSVNAALQLDGKSPDALRLRRYINEQIKEDVFLHNQWGAWLALANSRAVVETNASAVGLTEAQMTPVVYIRRPVLAGNTNSAEAPVVVAPHRHWNTLIVAFIALGLMAFFTMLLMKKLPLRG